MLKAYENSKDSQGLPQAYDLEKQKRIPVHAVVNGIGQAHLKGVAAVKKPLNEAIRAQSCTLHKDKLKSRRHIS
jgi:hypothetical protein